MYVYIQVSTLGHMTMRSDLTCSRTFLQASLISWSVWTSSPTFSFTFSAAFSKNCNRNSKMTLNITKIHFVTQEVHFTFVFVLSVLWWERFLNLFECCNVQPEFGKAGMGADPVDEQSEHHWPDGTFGTQPWCHRWNWAVELLWAGPWKPGDRCNYTDKDTGQCAWSTNRQELKGTRPNVSLGSFQPGVSVGLKPVPDCHVGPPSSSVNLSVFDH